jgi:hypothetical protein
VAHASKWRPQLTTASLSRGLISIEPWLRGKPGEMSVVFNQQPRPRTFGWDSLSELRVSSDGMMRLGPGD